MSCCSPPRDGDVETSDQIGQEPHHHIRGGPGQGDREGACDHPHERCRPSLTGGDDPEGQRQEKGQAQREATQARAEAKAHEGKAKGHEVEQEAAERAK